MITVAAVPAGHPYVEAVVDPESVVLLPDPVPPGATAPGQWWPPRFLDPAYLATRLDELDVLHVHFGFDVIAPEVLHEVTSVLAEHRIPLVVTVHDLENPHFVDPSAHRDRLAVLVAAATSLITLTPGAAREIEETWGRTCLVQPHPHVLPLEDIGVARPPRTTPVVAVHAKGLRANIDPVPVLDALVATAAADRRLRLDIDENALASARADELTETRLADYREAGVDIRLHPRFSDAALRRYLADIDVLVLPYRFGTHSGWIEACFDAGVCAVVPSCGYFRQQHDFPVYTYGRAGLDVDSLIRAVDVATDRVAHHPDGVDLELRAHRAGQRRHHRRQLTGLYEQLLAVARS